MKDGSKIGKFTIRIHPEYGKVYKDVEGDFDDDDLSDEFSESGGFSEKEADEFIKKSEGKGWSKVYVEATGKYILERETNEHWEKIDTVPCPMNFDNPDFVKEMTDITHQVKLTYQLDIDYSLVAIPNHHKHEIWTNRNAKDDSEDNTIDLGSMDCRFVSDLASKSELSLINEELTETEKSEKVRELAKLTPIQSQRENFNNSEKHFWGAKEYIQKNIESEIKRTVERLIFEYFSLDERGETRSENIGIMLDNEEKELRKRLQTEKGRVPIKLQKDFRDEREKFIRKCFNALEQLERHKEKLIKSKMAEIVFSDLNPQQSLRRKLKALDLSFEEILQKFNEQKSS